MARISIKAILIGGLTDVGLTMILGLPIGIYAALVVDVAHIPKNQIHSAITAVMHRPGIYFSEMFIGFACSVLGGYVAARIAKHDELLNGCLASFLCVAGGVWTISTGRMTDPLSREILLLITSPLLSLLGGYLRLKQRRGITVQPV